MATEKEIAAHLDLSDRSVRELKRKAVLPPAGKGQMDVDACRLAYIRHLRGAAAGRDSSRVGSLEAERARLAAAQAEAQERKNARERGELVNLPDITHAISGFVATIHQRFGVLPAAVSHGDTKLRVRIEAALNDALEDLSVTHVLNTLEHPDEADEEDENSSPAAPPASGLVGSKHRQNG